MSNENKLDDLKDIKKILERIKNSNKQRELWEKYQTKFPYARKIGFEELIETLKLLYSRVLN